MSLGTCLPDLRATGQISEAMYEKLRPTYEELVGQYRGRYGEAAEARATRDVLETANLDAMHRKRQTLLAAKKQSEWLFRMRQAVDDGQPLSRVAAEDFLSEMDGLRRSIRGQALQMNTDLLAKHRKNLLGEARHKSDLENVVRELKGEDTGDLNAREMADAWRQTGEWLRSRFNAAGGRIGKLDEWALPQSHDMRKVRDAGFEVWGDFVKSRLDRAKMIDFDTGQPFSDAKLEILLRDMHEAIASDGWSRNNPGAMFLGAVANRRADHRVLHFASADDWMSYSDEFGSGGTALDVMIGHIEGMSRDIAAMEMMGPNPMATLRWQQDWLRKSVTDARLTGKAADKASDAAKAGAGMLGRMMDEYSGANHRPERRRLALGFSIFRSQQVAAKLGGATLSVGGDFGLMAMNARFNGIPASKVLARYASMLNPANSADRAMAARQVLMADQWADGHAAQWRTVGEEIGHEGARRVASGVLRASGLVAHTDIARQAFGMEVVSHLTHLREKSFGNLDDPTRRLLQRYGIEEAQWDRMRRVQPESYKETDWLYPQTLADAGEQELADTFMRMIVTEADFAVPVPDLRTRTMINSIGKKGTWGGEIIRSGFLFKGFPLSIINMHGRRMLEQGLSRGEVGRAMAGMFIARYGITLLAMTTLGGALSLQAKEIAKGRDPRAMFDENGMPSGKFLGAAVLQGGGLGIFGDFLFSGTNRFGGGFAETLVGPGAQVFDNAVAATFGGVAAQLDSDPNNDDAWKKAVGKIVTSETPILNMWYARQITEKLLWEQVHEWSYGDTIEDRYRRMEQYAEDAGTQYYAPPGEGFDWRAPNFRNALGRSSDGEQAGDDLPPPPP